MIAHGNGSASVCANNLLRLVCGEVPFDRVRGLNPRLVDQPFPISEAELAADARWLIETYEPRVEFSGVDVMQPDAVNGGFTIKANIAEKEG